jgi:hypothetical protein
MRNLPLYQDGVISNSFIVRRVTLEQGTVNVEQGRWRVVRHPVSLEVIGFRMIDPDKERKRG